MENNNAWKWFYLSESRKRVQTRWAFDHKDTEDESEGLFKVLLKAKEFTQAVRVDCFDLYALVSKYTTVWLVISVSLNLMQARTLLDVKTFF